ncbi:hypothetical protein [Bifidobacterium primatium]|nr:hypothetical protein [Bifidobacterium primatium]
MMKQAILDDENEPRGAAMLDTGDIADLFRECDPDGYTAARRRFYHEVNLNPFKRHPDQLLRLIEWSFCDWFSYECTVDASSEDDEDDEGFPRYRVGPDGDGRSPFRVAGERLHDCGRINDDQLADMRQIAETNFATMFWIHDSNAAKGRIVLEDLIRGGEYSVWCPPVAAKYDGAHGGMIVNRIAKVDGAWRPCGLPVYETRYPNTPDVRRGLIREFKRLDYHPDFPGLIRFFYGRAKDTGLDWEDMAAAMGE